jgi:hypothetical protein
MASRCSIGRIRTAVWKELFDDTASPAGGEPLEMVVVLAMALLVSHAFLGQSFLPRQANATPNTCASHSQVKLRIRLQHGFLCRRDQLVARALPQRTIARARYLFQPGHDIGQDRLLWRWKQCQGIREQPVNFVCVVHD